MLASGASLAYLLRKKQKIMICFAIQHHEAAEIVQPSYQDPRHTLPNRKYRFPWKDMLQS